MKYLNNVKRCRNIYYLLVFLCFFLLSSSSYISLTSAESNLGYDVRITPSLLLTIPSDTVSLNLDPFTSAFGTANLPLTVSTNNPTGFTLNMSASETDLTLVNGSETIPTLADKTGGYSESEFTTNRWGYKLSTATNYSPFALSNELLVTDSPSNASVSTVNFASKVDATKPAGTYELEITFTAVANYVSPEAIDYCAQNSIADANCMQKMVASNCTTTAKTVMDSRDGEQYLVQQLADGKCWLLDNLRLDLTDSQTQANLGATTTNASNTTLNYLKNGGGTASDQYAMSGVENLTLGDSFSNPRINVSYKDYINPDSSKNYGNGSHKYGVYYNYCAASAGSYCYGNGTSSGAPVGDASEDICPAGWRMPTGGPNTVATDGKGEYQALSTAITGNTSDFITTTSVQIAISSPLSGNFSAGSVRDQGSGGYFWSNTKDTGLYMFYIYIEPTFVLPQPLDLRYNGNSVRCLLK